MPEVRYRINELKNSYQEWSVWVRGRLDGLVAELKDKKSKIESGLKSQVDCSRSGQGPALISAINTQIKHNNELAMNVDDAKRKARQKIEKHYAAVFFKEEDIAAKEQEISRLEERITHAGKVSTKIQVQINDIKDKISKAAIGAIKLNELLGYLLSDSNIEVQSVGEAEFRFLRGGSPANNLSDGEKTAVTLAYFLTSLEAEGESLEDTIVFIDDPICSLDSNHISEFFNLLKGRWLGAKGGNKPDSTAFYVRRIVEADGSVSAEIVDMPILLRKFKSEYEFVFWHLKSFSDSSAPSQHEAYTAPNLLRKFLEAYLGFRKPSESVWHKKLDLLFDEPEKQREIQKFSDDASHLQSMNRTLQEPAFVATAQTRVQEVIAALEIKDNGHYQSLVEVVNES
jgi:wobble nucleotide-excising tRNase